MQNPPTSEILSCYIPDACKKNVYRISVNQETAVLINVGKNVQTFMFCRCRRRKQWATSIILGQDVGIGHMSSLGL